MTGPTALSIYQLKITLQGIAPPVWRRIQVQGGVSLNKLHRIFQATIGWENRHLYEFIVGNFHFGEHHPEYSYEMKSDNAAKLYQVVTSAGAKFTYVYDFSARWEHELLVENIMTSAMGLRYSLCLAGERASPPEDCASVGGYANFLEAIRDPGHKEHEALRDWIGDAFDPESFDLNAVNERLKGIR